MDIESNTSLPQFCWLDLAAADSERAAAFYQALFGWRPSTRAVAGGRIGEFMLGERAVASYYQLRQRHLADGVPSHWTPYVGVGRVDRAAQRAAELGGTVVVEPFEVPGIASIALVQDATGALLGLRQPVAPAQPAQQSGHEATG